MGLLDDAIREHLELKKSRGADAQEISRQEREAFGPARSPEPATPAQPPEHVETEPGEHAGAVPMTPPAHEPPEPDPIPEPPVVEAEPPPPPVVEDDDIDWSEPAPRHAAEEPAPEDAAPDEDVLEETPEFLQETPEHDRLWFEQRPPKDFDF